MSGRMDFGPTWVWVNLPYAISKAAQDVSTPQKRKEPRPEPSSTEKQKQSKADASAPGDAQPEADKEKPQAKRRKAYDLLANQS